ncbi:hypothetical protein H8E07_10290 [bacterium]|nr:hypothetical protein [bacterium]
MPVSTKTPRPLRRLPRLGLLALLALAGCRDGNDALRLADLEPAEERYITRFVILERARAVALVDRAAGDALLDSLAASWGDSALVETLAALPDTPRRQAQIHALLEAILTAEEDSLLAAPAARRLHAPLSDPPPAPLPEPPAEE